MSKNCTFEHMTNIWPPRWKSPQGGNTRTAPGDSWWCGCVIVKDARPVQLSPDKPHRWTLIRSARYS